LANGATINSNSHNIATPLFIATKNGNLELVKLLIQNGASLTDDNGLVRPTAVMQAIMDEKEDILQVSIYNHIDQTTLINPIPIFLFSGSQQEILVTGGSSIIRSIYTEKKGNKEVSYILEPILAACLKQNDKLFEVNDPM
jgi:ankyrin repeat protein